MCKLFSRKYTEKDLKCIEEIKKTALQINLGEVDAYRDAIRKFLKRTGKEINSYFAGLGKDYFIVMTYYSHLIKDSRLGRISEPINVKEKIKNMEELKFAMQLIQWYENKWEKENAFSLIPKSLKGHNLKHKPLKYLLKLIDDSENGVSQVEPIDISCCYKNSEKWECLFRVLKKRVSGAALSEREKYKLLDSVLGKIEKSGLLDNQTCKEKMTTLDKEKNIKQFIPFVMAWYPLIKGWPYQYYIPSPMLSDTPVGGLVVGTKTILRKEDIDNLEDIALKVTVDINFIEHKEKVLQQSRRTAIASIMGRNMSHNIGSHVLSTLSEDYLRKKPGDVSVFHSYLQMRMDLLARITGTKPDWGEPLYFVGDLLKGFFSQTLLLNHIVSDQGKWKEQTIEFVVILPSKKSIEFKNQLDPHTNIYSWMPDEKVKYEDFLVSIPDGTIGAQAFYIFLESMMRNSAKYGKNKQICFVINIEVAESSDKRHYVLGIWDNFSTCDGSLITDIQNKIKEPLVNETTGELETKSFGIAEMREACDFLIHPHGKEFIVPTDEDQKCYPLWAKEKEANGRKYLTYTFNLAKPKMVAIVSDKPITLPEKAEKYGIRKISKDDLLTNKGAFQFAILFVSDGNVNEILGFIKINHRKLPQRLLLYCGKKTSLNANCIKPNRRRAFVCSEEDIKFDSILQKNSEGNVDNECKDFIIRVYETWIRKRWLLNENTINAIDLVIAFDRTETDSIWKKWELIKSSTILQTEAALSLKRILKDKHGHFTKTEVVFCREKKATINNNKVFKLYYDNHGCAGKNISSIDFINETGSKNKKSYETLGSPPQNPFMFNYFLLGLIEAGLTKVVIIDERVAESSIKLKRTQGVDELETGYLQSLNEALCFPLFAIEKEAGKQQGLTKTLNENYQHFSSKHSIIVLLKRESGNAKYKFKIVSIDNSNSLDDVDFIIFHNGIIETVVKDLFKTDDWYENLYELVPSIIITSGRGAILKDNVPPDSPFQEFSSIRENTIMSISKYHLVRSIMSTKGKN